MLSRCIIRLDWLFLLIIVYSSTLCAQESAEATENLESLMTDWIEQNPEADVEALAQEIEELLEQPINLNDVGREQLESLPFLNPDQKEKLAYFLYTHKPLYSLSELLLCEGMDELSLRRIRPFLYIGAESHTPEKVDFKKLLSRGKYELRMYTASGFQLRQGLINAADSALKAAGKAYLGLPFSGVCKCQYSYGRQFQYGLVMEHDLGEKPVDFLSFHIAAHNLAKINTVVLGDYRLNLGRGLLVASGFSSGKSSSMAGLSSVPKLVNRHFSSSESAYFRGAAIDVSVTESLQLLAFASCRKLDAAVAEGSFSSVRSDGLHRTLNEIRSKNSLRQYSAGAHIGLNHSFFQVGANVLYYKFNAFCNPDLKPYSLYYFRGRDNLNLSLDYRFRCGTALFRGECAFDKEFHTANYHQLQYRPHPLLNIVHSLRYYSPAYQAYFAAAFSENTRVCNEIGWFTAVEYRIFKHIKLDTYLDFFQFPWLKYGVNSPSSGYDLGLELSSYSLNGFEWSLRYRDKSKTENLSVEERKGIPLCAGHTKKQLRIQFMSGFGGWSFKTKAELNQFNVVAGETSVGALFSQECRYKTPDGRFSLSLQYAMFDTDSYENRVYFYEHDLPGVFSIPAYSGTGSVYVLSCKMQPFRNFQCWLRLRHRAYSDRNEVGSLLDVVQACCLTEFRLGFQYRFSAKSSFSSQNQP
ncbi:MAG: hypothetical protein PHE04_00100 [Bacteroidales bacterium]|nr:hypothetical protein [Bacteroidales bacterium]MDD3430413.1 hypothetical protein [Bacteroidales bacterium]MDD4361074.1 hypothetical protein [Bacteroidales bacterium]MDD4429884.1 hypothetical protein [Bacteroidales bacterium]